MIPLMQSLARRLRTVGLFAGCLSATLSAAEPTPESVPGSSALHGLVFELKGTASVYRLTGATEKAKRMRLATRAWLQIEALGDPEDGEQGVMLRLFRRTASGDFEMFSSTSDVLVLAGDQQLWADTSLEFPIEGSPGGELEVYSTARFIIKRDKHGAIKTVRFELLGNEVLAGQTTNSGDDDLFGSLRLRGKLVEVELEPEAPDGPSEV